MSALLRCSFVCLLFLVLNGLCALPMDANPHQPNAVPFDLADVKLMPGPLRDARDLNLKYLLELEPDRLLHALRKEAGLQPKGAIYGGWESSQLAGQVLGHYLTAISYQYRATSDTRLLDRIRYIVDELELCQQKHGDGYLAGIPNGRALFEGVSSGTITADQANLNGSWAPWYVIHKIMSGLRDAWQLAGADKARPMLIAMADWVARVTGPLTEEQLEKMMACEFGGMNEILLDVYATTGNPLHLATADRFYHNRVLDPLARGEDSLNGLHANTQIPKLIGVARRYELLGEARDRNTATFFWDAVVKQHCYAMGGHSDGEHFGPPGKLAGRLGTMTAETCNTYHMLKLTRHLFEWQPDARYFDFYERALYNHIRASHEPKYGRFAYFITLMPGHFRTYSTPFDAFWCCVDTGMENHTRYNENIYFHDVANEKLFVNLYIPSRLHWREKGVVVDQRTDYPTSDTIHMEVQTSAPTQFAIALRCPWWATRGMQAEVNGTPVSLHAQPGSFANIARTWNSGDQLRVRIPMELRKESMPDNPRRIAVFKGPLMLAARLGKDGMDPPIPYARDQGAYLQAKLAPVPVLLAGDRPVDQWLKLAGPGEWIYRTKGVGYPQDFDFAPFYSQYYERYAAYLDNFTPAEWEQKQAEYKVEQERVRKLENRTIDLIRPGDAQMERDHGYKGENSRSGNFENRMWRDALPGGWFSYDVKAEPSTSCTLMCTYWGSDTGSRKFRIQANGTTVAEPNINNNKPGEFFREEYLLPAEVLGGSKVTLRFEGLPGNIAGGVFEIRVVRPE